MCCSWKTHEDPGSAAMESIRLLFGLALAVLGCVYSGKVFAAEMMGLRLADGRFPNEGRVEVLPPGEDSWGSYCSNENPLYAGRVACRQLGFPALLSATASGQFGLATGPIWFQLIQCRGPDLGDLNENLDECQQLPWWPNYEICDHRFDVGFTCFTGGLRLVGGRGENEGRVEVHAGGDEWILLSFQGAHKFVLSDTICVYLGYPFSIGVTEEPARQPDNNQKILCSFSSCPYYDGSEGFFNCLDETSLVFCQDKNTTLTGAVCATEHDVLPIDAVVEYRLQPTTNDSQHIGILEARYNGSAWVTACIQAIAEKLLVDVANEVCHNHWYPWAFMFELIPFSDSAGYVSTEEELIMRELFLGPDTGRRRWVRGQNVCQRHPYELFHVECETGVTMYGLTVFPCSKQTCLGRCGIPATDELCGCDAVCSQCMDCCYDYKERCPVQEDPNSHMASPSHSPFSCTFVDGNRAVIVEGCSQEWNDTDVAQHCANKSYPGPIEYRDGMFFQNLHCADCNGLASSLSNDSDENNATSDQSSNSEWHWTNDYDVGIDICPSDDVDPEIALGCQSYSAALSVEQSGIWIKFKNPHCAYCNKVNISRLDYCPVEGSHVLPAHFEILLGRVPDPWAPESSTSLQLQDEIKCYHKHFQLRVLPTNRDNSSDVTEVTLCYLNTLSWQNVQLAWPFFASFIELQLQALISGGGGTSELITEYIANITDFEEILDLTVLPPHEEGSSKEWVMRCGVQQADFWEVCVTAENETINGTNNELPCEHSVFTTRLTDTRVFRMSGVQLVYVGGGVLVQAKSVSFSRTYHYRTEILNESAKDTGVTVCGQTIELEECRIPHARETMAVSTEEGEPGLEYQGKKFLHDQVTYLPDGWVLICSSVFSAPKESYISFSDPLTVLNLIGYCLSIVALVATFTNYCLFPVLRNVPGGAIMSLTAALFLAQLLTLTVLDKAEYKAFCISMAVLMHFLWLATFTWMNVLAFDLMRTFTSRQATRPNKLVFFTYCLYGWGVPLLTVTTCVVIHLVDGQRLGFRYGGLESCWVIGKYAVLGAFLVPMICSLIANAVLFGLTVRSVHASLSAAAMVRQDKTKSQETLGELWIYFKMSCVMGFTWLFGCLGNFVDSQVIWYLFIILNSLQGVFIFVSFGCNVRIRNLWRTKLGLKTRKNKRNSSNASSSLTSTKSRTQTVTSESSIKLHEVSTGNSV